MDLKDYKVFVNAQCDGPFGVGNWTFQASGQTTKPISEKWSIWEPSSGGLRIGKTEFPVNPLDYIGFQTDLYPEGNFDHVSLAFDSSAYPVISTQKTDTTFEIKRYLSANTITGFQFSGNNPILFNNILVQPNENNRDVVCYYTKLDEDHRVLYSRYSRDLFQIEYTGIDFGNKKDFYLNKLQKVDIYSGGLYASIYGKNLYDQQIRLLLGPYIGFPEYKNTSEISFEKNESEYLFDSGNYYSVIENGGSFSGKSELNDYTLASGNYYSVVFISGFKDTSSGVLGHYNLYSGDYYSVIVSGSGHLMDSGILMNSYLFDSGNYREISFVLPTLRGDRNILNSYNLNNGRYYAE